MDGTPDLEDLTADRVFDGGDLDCGSGLVLLLRENMAAVPAGGVLEMRSREPTVRDDLPPWCRMVGHELLGELPGDGFTRYFLRRGEVPEEGDALDSDKERAKNYEWRTRTRRTGPLQSTVYCRNLSFTVGQPASFEERDEHPSAVEVLLGSLAGALAAGFGTECSRDGLDVDDIEITTRATITNILAHLGMEEGDPAIDRIELRCFATTFDDEPRIREAWDRAVRRSPIAATLARGTVLETKLVIV